LAYHISCTKETLALSTDTGHMEDFEPLRTQAETAQQDAQNPAPNAAAIAPT
jgi:hypothetical protein